MQTLLETYAKHLTNRPGSHAHTDALNDLVRAIAALEAAYTAVVPIVNSALAWRDDAIARDIAMPRKGVARELRLAVQNYCTPSIPDGPRCLDCGGPVADEYELACDTCIPPRSLPEGPRHE